MSSLMYPENFEGTQVVVGSMNMGYISDTARNRTHLFRPKREPIPLGHSDDIMIRFDATRYDRIRYETIRHDTIRYDTVRYDTIRYDTILYDIINYSNVFVIPSDLVFVVSLGA